MKFIVFLGAFLWHLMPVSAQVKGMVKDNQGEPVVAANVFWINTTNGTVTDENGEIGRASCRERVCQYV